jgi:hypothetical protein
MTNAVGGTWERVDYKAQCKISAIIEKTHYSNIICGASPQLVDSRNFWKVKKKEVEKVL